MKKLKQLFARKYVRINFHNGLQLSIRWKHYPLALQAMEAAVESERKMITAELQALQAKRQKQSAAWTALGDIIKLIQDRSIEEDRID